MILWIVEYLHVWMRVTNTYGRNYINYTHTNLRNFVPIDVTFTRDRRIIQFISRSLRWCECECTLILGLGLGLGYTHTHITYLDKAVPISLKRIMSSCSPANMQCRSLVVSLRGTQRDDFLTSPSFCIQVRMRG